MERVLAPETINQIFEENASSQYTRELLFSSLVELMSLVVCGIYPSVSAAYREKAEEMNVTRTAVYDKLNGVETSVSSAIVRETAVPLASLIEFVGGKSPQLLNGYKVRILEGNCLEKTDHRLEILRTISAGALPGKSLVVLDPELRLAINVFACEDGHAQERSLFNEVLKTVKQGELWIADRNMCTASFLLGLHRSGANFVIRSHKSMPWKPITSSKPVGSVKTGELFEQTVSLSSASESLLVRRVVLKLKKTYS